MDRQKSVDALVRGAPKLSEAELEQINGLFSAYIFRRSKTREVWTSCCRQHRVIGDDAAWEERRVMQEPHREELRGRAGFAPQDVSRMDVCPWCGKAVKVKELRYTGKRKNLWEFHRPVVLRWWRGNLWACAYDAIKDYQSKEGLTDAPKVKLLGIYRFKPGHAVGTSRTWYGNVPFTYLAEQNTPLKGGKWKIGSPYTCCAEYGTGYQVIGFEQLEKSPFRYCAAEKFGHKHGDLLRYLTACCFYPRQIEMLEKFGMEDVVRELVCNGVKNAYVLNWEETDPLKAFGLSKQELKDFMATNRNICTLYAYKKLRKMGSPAPMKEAAHWVPSNYQWYTFKEIMSAAEKWNIRPMALLRYLEGEGSSLSMAWSAWKDYLHAAEALGYPLHRDNVLMPRGLGAAHDEAARRHREQMERERRNREAERLKAMEADYAERKEKLKEKYGFSMDGLLVCIPESGMEITEEGRILKHCVAGYADRHLKGTTTILFLRKARTPKKSFLTIEMDGNQIRQIHGYRNEGLYSAGGRFAPDPAVVYKDWLDTWLSWLKTGSKRDKNGQPKLPRKKTEVKSA